MIYQIQKIGGNSEVYDRVINCEMCGALVLLREAHKHVAWHEQQERGTSRIITPNSPNLFDVVEGKR
jgi:hypothetical protein